MGVPVSEIKEIQRAFEAEQRENQWWREYQCSSGIARVGGRDRNVSGDEKMDFCLVVVYPRPLPDDICLCERFRNVRVFWECLGRAKLY